MKKKIKIIIDIVMYLLFMILMTYQITSNFIHELLGVTLFIIHNILNINYYKTIFKGKYNSKRMLLLIINILLFIAMLGMIISGIMVSNNIFSFFNINKMNISEMLHRLSTSWGFIFMSIHLGLNINVMIRKIVCMIKNSDFEFVIYILLILIVLFGVFSFINLRFYYDLLLIGHFKFIGESNDIIYMLKVLFISLTFCISTYYIERKLSKGR